MAASENDWSASVGTKSENPETLLLTFADVARLLQVCPRTVERLAARGELPVVRIGRAPRVARAALLQWLERGGTAAKQSKEPEHGKFDF